MIAAEMISAQVQDPAFVIPEYLRARRKGDLFSLYTLGNAATLTEAFFKDRFTVTPENQPRRTGTVVRLHDAVTASSFLRRPGISGRSDLSAHGLPAALQPRRSNLGLPVPRFSFHAGRTQSLFPVQRFPAALSGRQQPASQFEIKA